eukprot:CAMPEP_0174845756 /NCGR_PEP_ID=MMETSP1114-20130205/11916_1 /TAXON_ID=312471 /ORGANISM="Neobodo designis, Strain CCAP 1951/1" /LENGTH=70 /DNA_ID=CAMNT_0016080011 /DNA_START=28 /DNA_END=236 /DNA_ORIENTATION=+
MDLGGTAVTVPSSGLSSGATSTTWPERDAVDRRPEGPKWRPPPKCVEPAIIGGCYQISLLSGIMLLFEAG